MTAQTPDAINVEGVQLSIQSVQGNALFNPAQVGWKAQISTTNCWPAFVETYAVNVCSHRRATRLLFPHSR